MSTLSLELHFISLTPPSCTGLGASFYSSYWLWLLLLALVLAALLLPALLQCRAARQADPNLSPGEALSRAPRLPDCLRDVLILLLLVHAHMITRTSACPRYFQC